MIKNQTKPINKQTLTKRESTNREHLSNAAIIGLANLYGIHLNIKVSTIEKPCIDKVTYDNLLIENSSLFSIEERKGMNRNEKKSREAQLINSVSGFIIQQNFLGYEECKRRKAEKTTKLIKYKWIDPFNEYGFYLFGIGIISIVNKRPKLILNKKQQIVELKANDEEIFELYCKCVDSNDNLSTNGKLMLNTNNTFFVDDDMYNMLYKCHIDTNDQYNQSSSCNQFNGENCGNFTSCCDSNTFANSESNGNLAFSLFSFKD